VALKKTKAGTWEARWREPGSRTGRRKVFPTKRAAESFLAEVKVSKDKGSYVSPAQSRMTLDEWWRDYFSHAVALRESTRSGYEGNMRLHVLPYLGKRPLASLTKAEIRSWLAGQQQAGVGAATVNAAYRVLRTTLNVALEEGLLARNPAARISAPRSKREEMRFLTPDEIDRVAEAIPTRYRALVYFLAYGGLRIGEATALRVENLDLLRGRVHVVEAYAEVGGKLVLGEPKTETSRRAVALPGFVRDELARHIEQFPTTGLVFTAAKGGPIRRNTFRRRVWVPALERARIAAPRPRVHDLRHTAVALAIKAAMHPKAIQARMGHSSISVTLDTYGHLFEAQDEVSMDRLGELARGYGGEKVAKTPDNVVELRS
jgi:integrase